MAGFATAYTTTDSLIRKALAGGVWVAPFLSARTVSDGATTSGGPGLTSATAAFTQADKGNSITGSGIPTNTYILTVTNATTVVMTANATATATGVAVTIGPNSLQQSGLFSATTGVMQAPPPSYVPVGWIDNAGSKIGRTQTDSEITPWGATQPVRTDITKDEETLDITCWETKLVVLGLVRGFATAAYAKTLDAGGSLWVIKPQIPTTQYYRVIMAVRDLDAGGEYVLGRYWPRMAVSNFGDITYANADAPIGYPVTLSSYYDSVSASSAVDFIGGDGWKANLAAAGVTLGP